MQKLLARLGLALLFISVIASCKHVEQTEERKPSHAGESMRMWAMARTFPDGRFHTENYAAALERMRAATAERGERGNTWTPLGPKNIGGRTLCIAVHPKDTNILFAGSASGGLWKSLTAGRGPKAWERIETGFPILGVSAIAIDPKDPNIMYVGTGEVYNLESSSPNVAFRTTRGTYGVGIIKTVNGGLNWKKSLDWSYGDLRGVQSIRINPKRPATIYAATTEGLMRSYDAGATWHTAHPVKMAVDVEISPKDTAVVFVTHGSLDDNAVSGIYRSRDAGKTFSKLSGGLSASYSGKTLLSISPSHPDTIYASVANAFNQDGLYRSYNGGDTWTRINSFDICLYQGWYSHDVAVHPKNPNTLMWVGIDAWRSTNAGSSVSKKTSWSAWTFGQVPVGGPEGPSNYVHADIHQVFYTESDPNKIYCATDGGIFVSYDGGDTWAGRNGGYQTQQFYANLGNSGTKPDLCIGGMQDNSTAIYTGSDAWTRVLGGDGECAAMDPKDNLVMYGSSQYLSMWRSTTGGKSWDNITPPGSGPEDAAFNGPFELAPSNPRIIYAGAQSIYRSNDRGSTWANVTNGPVAGGDVVLNIAIHPLDPDIYYFSTAPSISNKARVFVRGIDDGAIVEALGLPNRLCMDIAFHPTQPDIAYAVFAGFNTPHVWRTSDKGATWQSIDNGLPDIPTNSILIDPQYPDYLYVGNDLGVWFSPNGGKSWELYSQGVPDGFLAMHLSMAPGRLLRVATHGLGVWQSSMVIPVSAPDIAEFFEGVQIFPNPAHTYAQVKMRLKQEAPLSFSVFDQQGKRLIQKPTRKMPAGEIVERMELGALPPGAYQLVIEADKARKTLHFVKR